MSKTDRRPFQKIECGYKNIVNQLFHAKEIFTKYRKHGVSSSRNMVVLVYTDNARLYWF